MKIDVVLPVFNAEGKLERCLQGITKQRSEADINILIVDGGSSDRTVSIAEKYGCDITVKPGIYSDGLLGSRQYVISKSTAELLWFVDSDNYIAEDYVAQRLLEPFLTLDDVNISIPQVIPDPGAHPFSNYLSLIDALGIELMMVHSQKIGDHYLVEDMEHGITNCSLIRRSAILKIGGWDSDVKVLWRLRSKRLSKGAISETSHYYHVQATGIMDYIRKQRTRLRRFSKMTDEDLDHFYIKNSEAGGYPKLNTSKLLSLSMPLKGLREYYRTGQKTWLWGCAQPIINFAVVASIPLSAVNARRRYFSSD